MTRRYDFESWAVGPTAWRDEDLARARFVMPRRDDDPFLALNVLAVLPIAGGSPAILVSDPNGFADSLVNGFGPDFVVDGAIGWRNPNPSIAGRRWDGMWAWDGDESRSGVLLLGLGK